jgi:ArsR family transcriptional regulator
VPDLDATTHLCKLLADPTRLRLLAILGVGSFSVAELTTATRLPQPRVSTHLRRLKEAGLVDAERVGGQSFYTRRTPAWEGPWKPVLKLLVSDAADALLDEDRERAEALLAARHAESAWIDGVAGRLARNYSPGRTWESLARTLAGLGSLGRVIDIGSGDGAVAELLAPWASELVCVDLNARMVAAGRSRLGHLPQLHFEHADMHELPFPDGTTGAGFDRALVLGALQYTTRPTLVIEEAARVLRPGGRLVLSSLRTHPHDDVRERFGHRNLGFEVEELAEQLTATGLVLERCGVVSRERRPPHFELIIATASRPVNGPARGVLPSSSPPPAEV